ncbi:hypothetical protein AALP_AAs64104U000800 [Arabis alpina]|uniref:Uncharacterized protein n=1 Tax=Arabis alpina TaxID=50452 RepID=A0A087FZV2_ARAAL|nr:hypothetical protein AALP_AAs64104U000800 [Arabis alpina]
MERKRGCKIRKRGCSSSSSSSLARQNRFKRAIFAGKRTTQDDGGGSDQFQKSSLSARNLAATLWEISDGTDIDCVRSKKPSRNRAKKTEDYTHEFPPKPERIDLREEVVHKNSKLPQIEYKTICKNSVKTRFKNISNGLTTSKELTKVLKRINELDDDHKRASNRLISALLCELDRSRSSLKHLMSEFEGEEEEKRKLIEKVQEEAMVERKLRRQTEKMNRRLGKELAEAKEEMEREKRAKDVLEEVCDELAKGIGNDKKEMEKEREMMHIADVLREERVQMKLTEAKFEFEEKHEAMEKVRNELRRVLDGQEGKESLVIGRILEIIDGDGSDDDDDEESDLKSIELNMESGSKWGYVDSRQDHRKESRFVGDDDSDDDHVKRSVVVDNGERDESLKHLRDYIVSNVNFIGPSSSSEQWNHRHFPSSEFV